MSKPKALLISGYHAISQQHWADYVMRTCIDYEWHCIALPPRYFSWRMRGAPLSIAALDLHALNQPVDLLVATSSVDLSIVQSLYPTLRNTPSILYFHENQFAYPVANQPKSVVDWQMVNLYSALRADKLLFNSQFNRDSMIQGAQKLLKKLPDLVPAHLVESLLAKSAILPVPIKALPRVERNDREPLQILWNHRWEWDKQPELLLAITEQLIQQEINFKLTLTGQQFRQIPPALTTLLAKHADRIEHAGFIEHEEEYHQRVAQCHIVLSTAIHEFQGIAVLEAVQAGCIPLLPNRLSYPEFFPAEYLYATENEASIAQQAVAACVVIERWIKQGLPDVPIVESYLEDNLSDAYRRAIMT